MMRYLGIAAGALLFPMSAVSQEFLVAASAAAYGAMAYAECSKIGYTVDPQAWHDLVEQLAPGYTARDFGPNGRMSNIGGST